MMRLTFLAVPSPPSSPGPSRIEMLREKETLRKMFSRMPPSRSDKPVKNKNRLCSTTCGGDLQKIFKD